MNTLVPAEMLGRVSSVDWFVSIGLIPRLLRAHGAGGRMARTAHDARGSRRASACSALRCCSCPGCATRSASRSREAGLSRSRRRGGRSPRRRRPSLGAGLEPAVEDLAEQRAGSWSAATGRARWRRSTGARRARSLHRAQSAARTPATLFAAIEAPVPVQQQTTACSARPSATSRAAASRGPGPVVALVVVERAVQQRLVAAAAQLLDHGLGHASPLVGGHGDSHAYARIPRGHARAARGRDHGAPPVTRRRRRADRVRARAGHGHHEDLRPAARRARRARASTGCAGSARCWRSRPASWSCSST